MIKHNVSPNQIYFLDCCRDKIRPSAIITYEAEFLICQMKQLISPQGILLPKGKLVLEEWETFLVKTKKKVVTDVLGPNAIENVKRYREMFPTGRFPSKSLARQNPEDLKKKFIWFFQTYPEYDWKLIFDATHYYLYVKELADYQYAVTSSYFISKTDKYTKEVTSALADYCQELLDNPDLKNH